jgi:acyl-CoA thioesterase
MPETLAENATLDEVRAFFRADRFATLALGAEIVEARHGHAVVRFQAGPTHANAMGNLMGGAIFTLADYTFAIASSIGQAPTVAASATIDYLRGTQSGPIIAECDVVKEGARMCFAQVRVTDAANREIAILSIKGCRVG